MLLVENLIASASSQISIDAISPGLSLLAETTILSRDQGHLQKSKLEKQGPRVELLCCNLQVGF